MSKWPACWRLILILCVSGVWFGCVPIGDSPVDEEKDPNFIEGRNHVNTLDYKGAVEAFERALQANPRSAAAHFELGVLYQQRMNDPLSAAYHYQKYIELRPNSSYVEPAKQRIVACKMELAKTVTYGVVTRDLHRDLEKMTNDLGLMKQYNDALRNQLAAKPMIITQWQTLRVTNYVNVALPAAALGQTQRVAVASTNYARPATNYVRPAATNVAQPQVRRMEQRAAQATTTRNAQVPAATVPAPTLRKYVVRSGETMAQVARRFGVNIARLQAANPTIEPRRLRGGQTLNIPSQ
jgi:tetratricopeptide (TPR) repeat protein